MIKYLLDSNHASRLMGNEKRILARVQKAQETGDEFGISMTVLGEMYFAVYASQYRARNEQRLMRLLSTLHIYPFNQMAAEEFGRIQAEQKAKGRPIPPLDIQIAAVARQQGLTVLTADRHFAFIDALNTENWLAA